MLFLATLSMPERVFSSGPTLSPTWASVTIRLPLLVTVPDTVTVSPSVGVPGVRVSTETATEPVSAGPATHPSRRRPRGRGGQLDEPGQQWCSGEQGSRAPQPAAGR
ncbi:hypothetical protein SHKM778_93780 [Streptomyces sp. KM77-8]|uniref:Secreted protein n=1 Tax=Streptomyces haneummycinicus TaxID=3074435 RepID=A0AAT9HZB2_9ACTN